MTLWILSLHSTLSLPAMLSIFLVMIASRTPTSCGAFIPRSSRCPRCLLSRSRSRYESASFRHEYNFLHFSRSPTLLCRYVSVDKREAEALDTKKGDADWYTSHIAAIRSYNLAGAVNHGSEKEISISLGDGPNLVAVTGETGSGKSLLIARVAELITGGKATSSTVSSTADDENRALVEMGK